MMPLYKIDGASVGVLPLHQSQTRRRYRMGYRVVQWNVGAPDRSALRAILNHPGLELVGVRAPGGGDVATDAATLAGGGPVDVAVSTNLDELLALIPDCVYYVASTTAHPDQACDDLGRILRSGANAVSSALVVPAAAPNDVLDRLRSAADEGAATMFTAAGVADALLPLVVVAGCERVDAIRLSEVCVADGSTSPATDAVGIGRPPNAVAPALLPGAARSAWAGSLHTLAEALGWELDAVEEHHERVEDDGVVTAVRLQARGMVTGTARVTVEHVVRARDDVAPDWPHLEDGASGYRLEVDGEPPTVAEVRAAVGVDAGGSGALRHSTRLVNAIPAVCRARPGLLTSLDLPLVAPPTAGRTRAE